jgi:deoxyribonuclease-4
MRLGAHISTAGGVYKAFARAAEIDCETMLVFTKSNRQWKAKPLTEKDIADYQKAKEEYEDIHPVAVHASYLINIASPDSDLWEKSYQALKVEVERAGVFDIPLITFHPGSYTESNEEAGLSAIARGLRRLLQETAESASGTTVCLETMAGQGTNLGSKFEELAQLLEECDKNPRLGVCFDTCHVFSAGYDIRTPEAYEETLEKFDRVVGLDHIKTFHFNDSKFGLGEGKDRHEHIGQGEIGLEGFANFVNDSRWDHHAAHLETPKKEKDDDGKEVEMDPVNLAALRSVIRDK